MKPYWFRFEPPSLPEYTYELRFYAPDGLRFATITGDDRELMEKCLNEARAAGYLVELAEVP